MILYTRLWKSVGVPERLVVMEVMAAARAVMVTTSQLSVFTVGVPEEAMLVTLLVTLLLVRVCVATSPTTESEVLGKVITVASVPASSIVFEAIRVLPSAMVRVDPDAGAVRVTLFTEVGVIAPRVREMAGVVVAFATEPETPFAVVTETVVTLPLPEAPVAPVAPSAPAAPVGPVGPVTVEAAPAAPVGPVGPVGPPAGPVGPVGPVAPAVASEIS